MANLLAFPMLKILYFPKREQISFFDAPSISENNKLLLLNDKSTSLTGEL